MVSLLFMQREKVCARQGDEFFITGQNLAKLRICNQRDPFA